MKDFSYNTGSLRCPACDGTGQITMDVQFLPDVAVTCPPAAARATEKKPQPLDVRQRTAPRAVSAGIDCTDSGTGFGSRKEREKVRDRLQTLVDLGLGYLTLGEATPALSGGEAQRLKLAAEIGRGQDEALFVFDEPTIGLHPLDVRSLIAIFQRLIDQGATVIVIEHDLDMIANADYIIDMGPGGGAQAAAL